MRELLRTTDPTLIAFASALLDGEGIETFQMDVHMSVLEGSIGILPRRLMVREARPAARPRGARRQRDRARAMSAEDVTCDAFLGGRLAILQPRRGYRAGMDPVLLAAAVPAAAGETALELGCGAGVASLCLGARVPGLALTGVELQEDYAALARRNAAANGIALAVVTADLRHLPEALRARNFDHVLANPPYFRREAGTPAPDAGREAAMGEGAALDDWIDAAIRRLRPGGRLTMIQRADRLPEMLALIAPRLGSVVVRPVVPRAGRVAGRVLLSAIKGGRAAFRLGPSVVVHRAARHLRDGEDLSDEMQGVLRNGAPLSTI